MTKKLILYFVFFLSSLKTLVDSMFDSEVVLIVLKTDVKGQDKMAKKRRTSLMDLPLPKIQNCSDFSLFE